MAARIGLFGGTFDPVHRGHIVPVQAARRTLGLERVLYLPTAVPPHKSGRELAPAWSRFCMVELALLDQPGLEVSAYELRLGRPAYTIDTIEHFRAALPEAELYLLLGGDAFAELPTWRRWRDIVAAVHLAVMARPGWPPGDFPPAAAGSGMASLSQRVSWLDEELVDASSTRLRELLAGGGQPPPGEVPELVVDYIRKYNLYR